MSQKIKGRIDWYDNFGGFGIIIGDDGKEYFIHHSNLPANFQILSPGDRLVFSARLRGHNKQGLESFDIETDKSIENTRVSTFSAAAPNQQSTVRRMTNVKKFRNSENESGIFSVNPRPTHPFEEETILNDWDLNEVDVAEMQPENCHQNSSITDYWYQNYSGGASKSSSNSNKDEYEVKVVGVTYDGRQSVVNQLAIGEKVLLVREPNNPYDNNAIQVNRTNGQSIGYISRNISETLAPIFDLVGGVVNARVSALTGGYYEGSTKGVIIKFHLVTGES